MIAEELVVRGFEVAGLVLVVLAIGRNAFFSRGGRERDPMRMSPRDLQIYLIDQRVGYGKHVLRNVKLTRLSKPLIELRTNLFAHNRPDLWMETFEQTMSALRNIVERIDLYDQTADGMRKSDRRMVRKAIRTDAAALVKRTQAMLRASSRPLAPDVKNRLLGTATPATGTLLAEPMRRRIAAITSSIEEALRVLPASEAASDAGFTLRETVNRYLPDTLAAYFKLAAIDRAAAEAELEPQISIIEQSTRASIAALRDGRLSELTTNGIFLRDRLAAGQPLPPPAAPNMPTADRERQHADRTRFDHVFFFFERYISRRSKPASRD